MSGRVGIVNKEQCTIIVPHTLIVPYLVKHIQTASSSTMNSPSKYIQYLELRLCTLLKLFSLHRFALLCNVIDQGVHTLILYTSCILLGRKISANFSHPNIYLSDTPFLLLPLLFTCLLLHKYPTYICTLKFAAAEKVQGF